MDDIKLLIKTLTKQEMMKVIKHFRIKVQGFQRNFERAPKPLLQSSIEEELKRSFRRTKKGRKYISLDQMYNFIHDKTTIEHPNLQDSSLESVNSYLEMNQSLSYSSVLSILYTQLHDKYERHKKTISENIESNRFLLEGVVERIPTEEKMERLNSNLYEKLILFTKLANYEKLAMQKVSPAQYQNLQNQVNANGEESLMATILQTSESIQHIPMLAFLLKNKRYESLHYQTLVYYVIASFEQEKETELHEQIEQKQRDINVLSKDYNRLLNQYKKIEKDIMQLEEVRHNYNNLQVTHDDLKTQYGEDKRIWGKYQPFVSFFTKMTDRFDIIIISNDTGQFANTPFEEYVTPVSAFQKDRQENKVSKYKNKIIFVSRISIRNTHLWIACRRFFEQNQLSYCELSGYDFADHIKQIAEHLYTKEFEYTW